MPQGEDIPLQTQGAVTPPAEVSKSPPLTPASPVKFAAQSYMQYQASKFLKRFDANCYIHLTSKMDTHDVTRERLPTIADMDKHRPNIDDLKEVLSVVPPKALVISVESDVLFRNEYQVLLAECLPQARFVNLDSPDGHDGFLLEFEALGGLITGQLRDQFPRFYDVEYEASDGAVASDEVHSSVFGEAEPEF